MKRQYWFRAKKYGWGWMPATWQGWLVLALWAAVFAGIIAYLDLRFDQSWEAPVLSVLIGFAWTGVLVYIAYRTGERPRWSWGDNTDKSEGDK